MVIVGACAIEALERRADAAFGKQVTEEERNQRIVSRIKGKVSRRTWTDSIKDYMSNNEVSDNYRRWIYCHVSDQLNLALFNKKAKVMREERGVNTDELLRDTYNEKELKQIDRIESHAMQLVDKLNKEPKIAIAEAILFWM